MRIHNEHILPIVRIQKIELNNFKSIKHGEVLFKCGKKDIPFDTEADILGIYGQNGSGKTSVIEAISILKKAMGGRRIPDKYSECISIDADYAELAFTFDLQYPIETGMSRTVTYSFKMEAIPNEEYEEDNGLIPIKSIRALYPSQVHIFDETLTSSGLFNGDIQVKQDMLTTSGSSYPIGPVRKVQQYVGKQREAARIDLEVSKRTAAKDSKSFIFSDETLDIFEHFSNYSEYYQVLIELQYYARLYLFSIDSRASGLGTTFSLSFNTRFGSIDFYLMGTTRLPQRIFDDFVRFIDNINIVLPTIIPDLQLEFTHDEIIIEGRKGQEVKLFSKRKDTVLPLRNESAGIIKLISILMLIIYSFNDRSITVAIDELDAGIYEYLLGEILLALETYGRGQFIFTSHNLRPLEVLNKESILFTTSNPEKRFIRLKGVGKTNNLRNLYFKEITESSQDEPIYDSVKRQRMIAAFLKAGDGVVKEQ